ncbi:MAG TPA: hypothetical protein VJB70_03090 [Candidatus Paceibacterota bacterium]
MQNLHLRKTLYTLFVLVFIASPFVSFGAGSGATRISENSSARGSVTVIGATSKAGGTFMIDHPLDPKNKLLYHSFVESPDVKNIYDGIVVLSKKGEATIELPAYFMALNGDYRYLATAIGEPMPNLYVEKEVRKNKFTIAGGVSGGTISWQVTGIRHDPAILAYPIIPEVEKGPDTLVEKGEFMFPEYYVR